MKEILRSNDPVRLSFVMALLQDAGIDALLADQNTSIIEGSIGAIQRRILVATDQWDRAQRLLIAAGELPADRFEKT
jgi:hypothetical protein